MLNRQQCLMGVAAYHEAGYNWYTPRDDLVTVVSPHWDELILVFKDLVPTPDDEWDPDEWTVFKDLVSTPDDEWDPDEWTDFPSS